MLFGPFTLIIILTGNAIAQASPAPVFHQTGPDNETVYRISKQLCWNCIGESLEFLFAHNMVRAAKWELPLMWDFELQNYARWWAGQRQADCKLEHSFPEGEPQLYIYQSTDIYIYFN